MNEVPFYVREFMADGIERVSSNNRRFSGRVTYFFLRRYQDASAGCSEQLKIRMKNDVNNGRMLILWWYFKETCRCTERCVHWGRGIPVTASRLRQGQCKLYANKITPRRLLSLEHRWFQCPDGNDFPDTARSYKPLHLCNSSLYFSLPV